MLSSSRKAELTSSLAEFPSHFDLDCPPAVETINKIKDRIKEEEDFYDSKVNLPCLHEHFKCRDLNLVLYLDYKSSMVSWPGRTQLQMKQIRKMIDMAKGHPDNMIALSNLARLKLQQQQLDDAERYLEQLKELGPWERVLADAEMAYACRRIGPHGHWKCKELSEKVVYLRDYPSLTEGTVPVWHNELKMEYSYQAALAIQRLFNACSHSNIFVSGEVTPEELMKVSAELLKTVAMSSFSDSVSVYQTLGWLMLSETFRLYKRSRVNVYQREKRPLRIADFGWPGLDSVEQCLQKAVEAAETRGLSNTPFRILQMLGNEFRRDPNLDLDKAEQYLKQAAEMSTKPAIHHHLALVYRQKWLRNHRYHDDKRHHNVNIRDSGHPLLQKAITHMEKANAYSHYTSVLYHVELARLKYSYCEEPISKESRDDIMDTLNGCTLVIDLGKTTKSVQAYLFHQLALMHLALFDDAVKYRQNLQFSVEKSVQCKEYSAALPLLKEMVVDKSFSERYRNLGEMYTIFERYEKARWNLERARERNPDDPSILENLVVSLMGLEEFQAAKQGLIILKGLDTEHLGKPENRERYMDVSLKVAQQFNADLTASIYQELIEDLHPQNARDVVVVISSEEPSDTVRTKALVHMIRRGLGFNEDNCILPMEAVWKQYGDMERSVSGGYLEDFVKKAWCVVIHLTDLVMREGLESLLRDIDNSIEDIWDRKGHVVVVDDVTTPGSTDWKRSTGKMRRCQQWISYSELFRASAEVVAPDATNAAEQVDVHQVGHAQELGEDCAAALHELQITGPSNSTATDSRVPPIEARESTATETVLAKEQRERTAGAERVVPVTEPGDNTATERREESSDGEERRAGSANEQGTGVTAHEVRASDQSSTTATDGAGGDVSATEAAAHQIQSWTPSALERLVRAMLSANQLIGQQ